MAAGVWYVPDVYPVVTRALALALVSVRSVVFSLSALFQRHRDDARVLSSPQGISVFPTPTPPLPPEHVRFEFRFADRRLIFLFYFFYTTRCRISVFFAIRCSLMREINNYHTPPPPGSSPDRRIMRFGFLTKIHVLLPLRSGFLALNNY